MKWWYWLILELLIIFGTITWIYFFPSEIEYDFGKGLFCFALIYAIEKYRETNRRNKMSESYVVEQNAGENQIESRVVSVSGSVSEKKYRPFKDCEELIRCYEAKYAIRRNACLTRPLIWIRDITEDAKGDIELITGFTEHGNVLINGTSYPLQHLFQMYEFLDGTPVGMEE